MYLNTALSWPEDGRLRPKNVAKYNLIVIIASCLDVCCVLMVHNILYKFDTHNGMASLSLSKKKSITYRLKKSNEMQQYADIYLLLNYPTFFGRPSRPSSGVHKR